MKKRVCNVLVFIAFVLAGWMGYRWVVKETFWGRIESGKVSNEWLINTVQRHPFLLHTRDNERRTPLLRLLPEPEVLRIFLECNADSDALSDWGEYALQEYAYRGDAEAVELLLNAGADIELQVPDAKNAISGTALHVSCRKRRGDVVRLLLLRGADPNSRIVTRGSWNGCVPLESLFIGHEQNSKVLMIAENLIRSGADPYLKNDQGITVLQEIDRFFEETHREWIVPRAEWISLVDRLCTRSQ